MPKAGIVTAVDVHKSALCAMLNERSPYRTEIFAARAMLARS